MKKKMIEKISDKVDNKKKTAVHETQLSTCKSEKLKLDLRAHEVDCETQFWPTNAPQVSQLVTWEALGTIKTKIKRNWKALNRKY